MKNQIFLIFLPQKKLTMTFVFPLICAFISFFAFRSFFTSPLLFLLEKYIFARFGGVCLKTESTASVNILLPVQPSSVEAALSGGTERCAFLYSDGDMPTLFLKIRVKLCASCQLSSLAI